MAERKPGERDVCLRIRVKPAHADDAALEFEKAGIRPIHVEHRSDGAVSFWFGKDVAAERLPVASAIPIEWYAVHGIVR